MAGYAGLDTTRVQRLGWWVGRLGRLLLTAPTDDDVFAVIADLTAQRGRYFAGKDATAGPS